MAETPSIYALLEQATWIQSLARSLVSDPHAADDLVQDTWLSALEHRPDAGRPVRGWLATVLRNHLQKRRRGERNRSLREADASRTEAIESTLDVVEKASTHRDLVETVLDLEEPYRSTLLMRFFEQLSPAEIARRTSTSRDTVSSRLTRGLERLRTRLEARHGGDRRALHSALIALARPSSGIAVPTLGVKLMHVALGASLLAVTATAVSTFPWQAARSADPVAPVALADPAPPLDPVELATLGGVLSPVEPVQVAPAVRTALPLAWVDGEDDWTAEFSETLPLSGAVRSIAVNTGAGSVEVQPSLSGLVEIEARVRADRDRADPAEMTYVFADHVKVEERDEGLTIEDAHEGQGWSVSLLVRLPGSLPVFANSGAGSVTVTYAGSSVQANSGAGDVTVRIPDREVGSVEANSGAGRVEVQVLSAREKIGLNSGAGAVRLEVRAWDSPADASLNSGAGSAVLVVPPNVIGSFDLESDLGKVTVPRSLGLVEREDGMGGSARGRVGSGGGSYRLRSGVGSVTLELAGQRAPRPL